MTLLWKVLLSSFLISLASIGLLMALLFGASYFGTQQAAVLAQEQQQNNQNIVENDRESQTLEAIAKAETAGDQIEKAAATWPIVLQNAKKSHFRQADENTSYSMSLVLNENPFDWSVSALRTQSTNTDKSTPRIEIYMFINDIPWWPLKEGETMRSMMDWKSGQSETLEWNVNEAQKGENLFYSISFRLRSITPSP